MRILRGTLEVETSGQTDVVDLTEKVAAFLDGSGIREGQVLVFAPGSTAGITTIEFESGAVNDLKRAIERLAPRDAEYEHDRRWGDGNGYSHVRAALLGPSVIFPVSGGKLETGSWQQIVLCDFDNRPRQRRILLQVVGS